MFINELHNTLVDPGRLVVNDGRMLMGPDAPTLTLPGPAIRFARNPGSH